MCIQKLGVSLSPKKADCLPIFQVLPLTELLDHHGVDEHLQGLTMDLALVETVPQQLLNAVLIGKSFVLCILKV